MRRLIGVFSLMMCFGYYCSSGIKGESGGFGRDTGVDIEDDTGSSLIPRVCPDYSGFLNVDSTHSWRTRAEWAAEYGSSGTWSTSFSAWTESDDVALITQETSTSFVITGYEDYTTHQRVGYRCDADGLWLLASRLDYAFVYEGTAYSGWTEVVYTEPMLVLRPGLVVGSSWGSTVNTVTTTSTGSNLEGTVSYQYEVVGEEVVQTPAGEFNTLKLVNSEANYAQWMDADAGVVLTDSGELVSWSR